MRGPAPPPPRRGVAAGDVRALLLTAEVRLLEIEANLDPGGAGTVARLQRAEQDLLLVRLAADTGARRGEVAALRFADLAGRSLTITGGLGRTVDGPEVRPQQNAHGRDQHGGLVAHSRRPVGAACRPRCHRALGPWLFASDPGHRHRLGAEVLGHRYAQVAATAGVSVTLHQLRPATSPPAANPALGRPWRSTTSAPHTSEQGNVHAAPNHYAR